MKKSSPDQFNVALMAQTNIQYTIYKWDIAIVLFANVFPRKISKLGV